MLSEDHGQNYCTSPLYHVLTAFVRLSPPVPGFWDVSSRTDREKSGRVSRNPNKMECGCKLGAQVSQNNSFQEGFVLESKYISAQILSFAPKLNHLLCSRKEHWGDRPLSHETLVISSLLSPGCRSVPDNVKEEENTELPHHEFCDESCAGR